MPFSPYINAQAKHVLIIMEIGLGYFSMFLHTITTMVEAENTNSFSSGSMATSGLFLVSSI